MFLDMPYGIDIVKKIIEIEENLLIPNSIVLCVDTYNIVFRARVAKGIEFIFYSKKVVRSKTLQNLFSLLARQSPLWTEHCDRRPGSGWCNTAPVRPLVPGWSSGKTRLDCVQTLTATAAKPFLGFFVRIPRLSFIVS